MLPGCLCNTKFVPLHCLFRLGTNHQLYNALNVANLNDEISRRRTFAIISHPDAGKTTLTEKLLLYGGAIHIAGAVKSNKIKKTATSDWMEIEKQRGISVATSVMGFNYGDYKINILDTPGHQDFAEDTYRTLTAVEEGKFISYDEGVDQGEYLLGSCHTVYDEEGRLNAIQEELQKEDIEEYWGWWDESIDYSDYSGQIEMQYSNDGD